MVPDWMINISDLMQSSLPILSLGAYVPQWVKLIKTKSSASIAIYSWVLWVVSSGFASFYAVVRYYHEGHGLPLVWSSVSNLFFVLVTLWLIILYRVQPSHTLHQHA